MAVAELAGRLRKESTAFPTLGVVVLWQLSKLEIARADFENRVANAGLPTALVPRIEAAGALRKALEALGTKHLIRCVVDDDEKLCYALVDESVDRQELDLDYATLQVATYDRTSRSLATKTGFMAVEIGGLFAKFSEKLTAREVRRTILNTIDAAHGVLLKDRGGVYFVPRPGEESISRLDELIAGLGNGSMLFSFGITDSKQTRSSMLKMVTAEIGDEISAVEKDVADILTRDNTRGSTLVRRLNMFKQVREKVRCYTELLQFEASGVEARLKALEERVRAAL